MKVSVINRHVRMFPLIWSLEAWFGLRASSLSLTSACKLFGGVLSHRHPPQTGGVCWDNTGRNWRPLLENQRSLCGIRRCISVESSKSDVRPGSMSAAMARVELTLHQRSIRCGMMALNDISVPRALEGMMVSLVARGDMLIIILTRIDQRNVRG